jgi:tRNA(Ile)-lysidine synthase
VEAGVPAGALFAVHVDALDALVGPRWRGQGPVDLPGGLQGRREGGQVRIAAARPVQ